MRFYLAIVIFMLTACEVSPTPLVATRVQNQVKPPTAAGAGTSGQLTCGAEAAITLAQTQSDLALAALTRMEALQKTTSDNARLGKEGQTIFATARNVMKSYAVPDCLAIAKTFAVKFFDDRVVAYVALAANDKATYDKRLAEGEAARQSMVEAVNKVLAESK
jgi:hypothetical protein